MIEQIKSFLLSSKGMAIVLAVFLADLLLISYCLTLDPGFAIRPPWGVMHYLMSLILLTATRVYSVKFAKDGHIYVFTRNMWRAGIVFAILLGALVVKVLILTPDMPYDILILMVSFCIASTALGSLTFYGPIMYMFGIAIIIGNVVHRD